MIDQVITAVLSQEGVAAAPEIIVVGRDEPGIIPIDGAVRFLDTGFPVTAAVARNRGAAATSAELLIFLDSDCLPQQGWLRAHQLAHAAGHRVVSGSVLPQGSNYWHLIYNLTLFHEVLAFNAPGPRNFLATLNLSVAREVFATVGGMDETVNRVEDVDWTTRMLRAGIQPFFWPTAAVYHAHNRKTVAQVWRDCALSGYHMRWLRLRHADLLQAPGLLRYPRLVWWFAPVIAAWATGRIMLKRPLLVRRFWHTLPGIYFTKIAWCWGASQPNQPGIGRRR